MSDIEFTDRYKATGTPYPDPDTMCEGQCEGMGRVPVHKDDENDEEGNWHDLWVEAEAKKSSEDGCHFVICPTCNGTKLKKETMGCRPMADWKLDRIRELWDQLSCKMIGF